MGLHLRFPFYILITALSISSPVRAQEWTRFRGPNGSGIGQGSKIPVSWELGQHLWKRELPGHGHSSPVLWGEKLFVTSSNESEGPRKIFALNAANGQIIWQRTLSGTKYGKHRLNSFATATPTVDQDSLYVCWATPDEFIVFAFDHHGQEIWQRDLGPLRAGYGLAVSPILYKDLLIIANDQDGDSSLIALENKTGTIRWQVPRNSKTSYATPCIYRSPQGQAALIFVSYQHGITAVNPTTGKTAWELDIFDKRHLETSIGSPIVANNLILASSGWLGVRKEVIAVRPPATGSPAPRKPETVYKIDRAAPLCTTPVFVNNLLFLWSDEGIVSCADPATGTIHWRERVGDTYYGSPVSVNNRIYCLSTGGDAVVLAASSRFQPLARNPLGEGSHSTPAISNGRMYLRTFSQLICIGP